MPVPTEILTDCSRFVCCIFHFFAIFAVKLNNRRRMKAERISFWENVQEASCELALWNSERAGQIVNAVADRAEEEIPSLLEANRKDLERMDVRNPKYDRLKLTEERIRGIAADLRNVASLPSPLGRVLRETVRPNGMRLRKVSVPFGVVGIIYEARPNVGFDVFSICLKSGNACVLKGGSDAEHSNRAIVDLIHRVLADFGANPHVVELLPAGRESTAELLEAVGYVDLIIPRGSRSLIDFVRDHARVPVIETGAGICHTYFDEAGDKAKASAIVFNAKTRRVSVCNALDCLLIHRSRLADLPDICAPLAGKQVVIYADPDAFRVLEGCYPAEWLEPATAESFGTEFLDYKMAVRTVDSLDAALVHIRRYGSKHSECIVTEDSRASAVFARRVDAACVYTNVSTAFTDGAQFGLGAEIGISTQKLHARGPMGLEELTTYKWLIEGDGQVREK